MKHRQHNHVFNGNAMPGGYTQRDGRLFVCDRTHPHVYRDAHDNVFICHRCKEGPSYKKGHTLFCCVSIYYGKSYQEVLDEQRLKKAKAPVGG